MTRFIQANVRPQKAPKEPKRTLPKSGSYSAKDLQAKGVKSGVWEKKDG